MVSVDLGPSTGVCLCYKCCKDFRILRSQDDIMQKLIALFDSTNSTCRDEGLVPALLEATDKVLLVLNESLLIKGMSRVARTILPMEEGGSLGLWDIFYPDNPKISTPQIQGMGPKEMVSLGFGGIRLADGEIGRARLSLLRIWDPQASQAAFLAQLELPGGQDHACLAATDGNKPGLNIHGIADPALIIESRTRIIHEVNEGYCRIFGWDRRDLIGMSTLGIHESGQAWKDFARKYEAPDAALGVYRGSWRFRSHSGKLIPCHVLMLRLDARVEEKCLTLSILLMDEDSRPSLDEEEAGPRPESVRDHESSQLLPVLTSRQSQIVMLLAKGLSSKEIGRILGISESTVKNHLSQLYRRFQCPSRISLLQRLKVFSST